MKQLVILGMHGAGGAGSDTRYSPYYPWSADDELQEFINNHCIIDQRLLSDFFRGVYWKGIVEAGFLALKSGVYSDVTVLITKSDIVGSAGKWFAIGEIKKIARRCNEIDFIPIGKSLGGFQSIEVINYLSRKLRKKKGKFASIEVPFSIMVDPDDSLTWGMLPARKVPEEIKEMVVVRQENRDPDVRFFSRALCGRKMLRKGRSGSDEGIKDYCYPMPPLKFPVSDTWLPDREVSHWTIDEHMVLIGHPDVGTVQDILRNWFEHR